MNKYLTIPLYKSFLLPLIGFGRIFLILRTKGRKTGKIRSTPLEYHRFDGVINIFSGRGEEADWLKNMKANPNDVWVRHGFHKFHATIEIVDDLLEKENTIKKYVIKYPRSSKMLFGWNPKKDDPETANITSLSNKIVIVRLHPTHNKDQDNKI